MVPPSSVRRSIMEWIPGFLLLLCIAHGRTVVAADAETVSPTPQPVTITYDDRVYEWWYPTDPDDPDSKVAYWREDMALNYFHWRWHSVFPAYFEPTTEQEKRDRIGEIFPFVHEQILARYDSERLSVGLPRVRGLHEFKRDAPIPPYDSSHLHTNISGRVYPSRPNGLVLDDMNPDNYVHMYYCYQQMKKDLKTGKLQMKNGTQYKLKGEEDLELLGGIVLGSKLRKIFPRYCEFHGEGHFAFSHMHDVWDDDDDKSEIIALPRGAMRDPLFYMWHKLIDDIFWTFRATFKPYTEQEAGWNNVGIASLSVQGNITSTPDKLITFWQNRTVSLIRGIDFGLRHPIKMHFKHIQHEDFEYVLRVDNNSTKSQKGVVRIYLAPLDDENGKHFDTNDLTRLFIHMDTFIASLSPGRNEIRRHSSSSIVTNDNFGSMEDMAPFKGDDVSTEDDDESNYCQCGYADNLLIPRGNPEGMKFVLYAIITDANEDMIDDKYAANCTHTAYSYCGALNGLYPDKRPMGFPFDRYMGVDDIGDFLTPNMATSNLKIYFKDEVLSNV